MFRGGNLLSVALVFILASWGLVVRGVEQVQSGPVEGSTHAKANHLRDARGDTPAKRRRSRHGKHAANVNEPHETHVDQPVTTMLTTKPARPAAKRVRDRKRARRERSGEHE